MKPRCEITEGHTCPYDSIDHPPRPKAVNWRTRAGLLEADLRAMRSLLSAREGEANIDVVLRARSALQRRGEPR